MLPIHQLRVPDVMAEREGWARDARISQATRHVRPSFWPHEVAGHRAAAPRHPRLEPGRLVPERP